MKKSELKQPVTEVMAEMSRPNKKKVVPKRKPRAASKTYSLVPAPDPLLPGEMELRVKGKLIASLFPSPEDGANQIRYVNHADDSEYGCDGPIEAVAKTMASDYLKYGEIP